MADEGNPQGTQPAGNTGEVPAWVAQLPADMRDDQTFHSFKTIGDLGKAFKDTSTKAAEVDGLKAKMNDFIPKLTKDSTDEEKNVFYQSLGRPEEATGYEFKGENLDADMVEWFRGAAFSRGLSKEAAESLFQDYLGFEKSFVEKEIALGEKQVKDSEAALRKEWGDQYDANIKILERFREANFTEGFRNLLTTVKVDGVFLGNHPEFVKPMVEMIKKTGEDTTPPGSRQTSGKPKNEEEQAKSFYPNTMF